MARAILVFRPSLGQEGKPHRICATQVRRQGSSSHQGDALVGLWRRLALGIWTTTHGIFQLDKFTANQWVRCERDLQADITTLWPGKTLSKITGVYA